MSVDDGLDNPKPNEERETYEDARSQVPSLKEAIGNPNSGLPEGAIRIKTPELVSMLAEDRIEQIEFYNKHNQSRGGIFSTMGKLLGDNIEIKESDFHNPTFNNELHPNVEGIDWYRGMSFKNKETGGEVFLFFGWMQPWYKGGAPDPMIFERGNVEEIEKFVIVKTYCEVGKRLRENPSLTSENESKD
jgi:hypothetical protein